jgi:hypothetical protein
VTTGGARRGRRDNGLDAADYAVAGDVDPRVGEHLLDVLAAGGIAAYLQPTADLNPILRATTLPARPIDRLYVDRAHLETARGHLEKVTGGALPTLPATPPADARPQAEVDAEWDKIIAGFHTTDDSGTPQAWPVVEGTVKDDPPQTTGRPVGDDGRPLNRRRTDPPPEEQSILYGLDTFGADLPEGDEEDGDRYVPPPPPPLPKISKYAVLGLIGVVAGFLLFLFPWLLPLNRSYVTLFGFAAIVGGAVTLVWRLRSGDDDDDDDDGAVV